jgi:UDPglucose 6-dehydrogenase
MGDGDDGRLRDNISMSWLGEMFAFNHDTFADLMRAREDQVRYLADVLCHHHYSTSLPVIVLGKAAKAETNSTTGSPALLLANILTERHIAYLHVDPELGEAVPIERPALYFIATRHRAFVEVPYPPGSITIDPWGYISPRPDVQVIAVGCRPAAHAVTA